MAAKLFCVTSSTAKTLPGTEAEIAKETGTVAEKNVQLIPRFGARRILQSFRVVINGYFKAKSYRSFPYNYTHGRVWSREMTANGILIQAAQKLSEQVRVMPLMPCGHN